MGSGRNPAAITLYLVGFLVLSLAGYDIVRAYWLPIELNRAMGGHYALPMVSSAHKMRAGLRTKKREWHERDIEFTYFLRRGGTKRQLRGNAIVETRFLKYAGLQTITVSMDRDLFVPEAEMPVFKKSNFQMPDFTFKLPKF